MQKYLIAAVSLMFVLSATIVLAPDTVDATNSHSGVTVSIPSNAVEVADNVFSIGSATDPTTGLTADGFLIVDKRASAKPNKTGKPNNTGGGGKDKGTTCYAFLARGNAHWESPESWVVNPTNSAGVGETFVFNNLVYDMQKWEEAAKADIFGDGTVDTSATPDLSSIDGENDVAFGNIADSNTIAYTYIWWSRGKNPYLLEWDMVFDSDTYNWTANDSVDGTKMDFENIATHEIGHAAGMAHPPDTCIEETMFAYAGYGETKKRDLHDGDIEGVQKLYG